MDCKHISITKDEVSMILWKRWIICYMLYDWNLIHADNAFENNELDRYAKVCKRLGENYVISGKTGEDLTNTYNEVLCEDVEGFIAEHMEVWEKPRTVVEMSIAKAMAKVFPSADSEI